MIKWLNKEKTLIEFSKLFFENLKNKVWTDLPKIFPNTCLKFKYTSESINLFVNVLINIFVDLPSKLH